MEVTKEKVHRLGFARTNRKEVYQKEKETIEVTSHLQLERKQSLFVGCSNGHIVVWRPKPDFKADIFRSLLEGHIGAIFGFLYLTDAELGSGHHDLLVSCSGDRTIKVWDAWDRDIKKRCIQTLVGHGGSVVSIVWCKEAIISASTDGTIRVWKADSARSLLLYPWFNTCQIIDSNDGLTDIPMSLSVLSRAEIQALLVGDSRGRILVYRGSNGTTGSSSSIAYYSSLSSGAPSSSAGAAGGPSRAGPSAGLAEGPEFTLLRSQKIHTLSISRVLVVPHETLVLTISFDNTVQCHDALKDRGYFAIENPNRCRYVAMSWHTPTKELFLIDEQGYIQVWNIFTEQCLLNDQICHTQLIGLQLLSDDRFQVSNRDDIFEYRLTRRAGFAEYKGHDAPIIALVMLHDRPLHASVQRNRDRRRQAQVAGGILQGPKSRTNSILHMTNSKNGTSGSMADGETKQSSNDNDNDSNHNSDDDHDTKNNDSSSDEKEADESSTAISPSRNHKRIAAAAAHHRRRRDRSKHSSSTADDDKLALPDDGQHLYSASLDMTVRCWDAYDMSCLSVIKERSSEISCMIHLPSSIILVTGHDNGILRMWNIDSGSSIPLHQHTNTVSCLRVAHTSRRDFLLSGSYDHTVAMWDITKRKLFNPLPEYVFHVSDEEVLCVEFNESTSTIITGGNDPVIRMWDLWTREPVGVLDAHTEPVTCMVIDGLFLISASEDGSIKIWDLVSRFVVRTLSQFDTPGRDGHLQAVRDLIIIRASGYLVSCAFDGQIIVWDYTNYDTPVKAKYVQDKRFRCLLYHPRRPLRARTGATKDEEKEAAELARVSLAAIPAAGGGSGVTTTTIKTVDSNTSGMARAHILAGTEEHQIVMVPFDIPLSKQEVDDDRRGDTPLEYKDIADYINRLAAERVIAERAGGTAGNKNNNNNDNDSNHGNTIPGLGRITSGGSDTSTTNAPSSSSSNMTAMPSKRAQAISAKLAASTSSVALLSSPTPIDGTRRAAGFMRPPPVQQPTTMIQIVTPLVTRPRPDSAASTSRSGGDVTSRPTSSSLRTSRSTSRPSNTNTANNNNNNNNDNDDDDDITSRLASPSPSPQSGASDDHERLSRADGSHSRATAASLGLKLTDIGGNTSGIAGNSVPSGGGGGTTSITGRTITPTPQSSSRHGARTPSLLSPTSRSQQQQQQQRGTSSSSGAPLSPMPLTPTSSSSGARLSRRERKDAAAKQAKQDRADKKKRAELDSDEDDDIPPLSSYRGGTATTTTSTTAATTTATSADGGNSSGMGDNDMTSARAVTSHGVDDDDDDDRPRPAIHDIKNSPAVKLRMNRFGI